MRLEKVYRKVWDPPSRPGFGKHKSKRRKGGEEGGALCHVCPSTTCFFCYWGLIGFGDLCTCPYQLSTYMYPSRPWGISRVGTSGLLAIGQLPSDKFSPSRSKSGNTPSIKYIRGGVKYIMA